MRIMTILFILLCATTAVAEDDSRLAYVDVTLTKETCNHLAVYVNTSVGQMEKGWSDLRVREDLINNKNTGRLDNAEYVANWVVYNSIEALRKRMIDPGVLYFANKTYPVNLARTIMSLEQASCMGRIGTRFQVPKRMNGNRPI
jgi:hypothetical protein